MERRATPPSTPPWALTGGTMGNKSNSTLPTTPPAIRKYSTGNLKVESALIKSTSHESQLGHKLTHPSASDLALVGSYLPVSAASNSENPPTMCGDQSRPMVSSSMASSITSNLNSAVYSMTSTTPSSSYILRSSVSDMQLSISNANLTDEEDNLFKEGTVSVSKGVFRQKRIPTEPSDLSVLGEYLFRKISVLIIFLGKWFLELISSYYESRHHFILLLFKTSAKF